MTAEAVMEALAQQQTDSRPPARTAGVSNGMPVQYAAIDVRRVTAMLGEKDLVIDHLMQRVESLEGFITSVQEADAREKAELKKDRRRKESRTGSGVGEATS